jgi:membrane protease YdiL (CAAX protease family)
MCSDCRFVFSDPCPFHRNSALVLRHIIPDHSIHFNTATEVEGQTPVRILSFTLATVLVTWIGIRRIGYVNLGLTLHGWQRSLALIAVPYGLCVAVAIVKPGAWSLGDTVVLIWLGLSVATGEEVVFRGMIMHELNIAGFGIPLVVTTQALLFAIIHIPSYHMHFGTAIPLAIFCGVARQYSGSLEGPIILHGTRGLFLLPDLRHGGTVANKVNGTWMTALAVSWFICFLLFERFFKTGSKALEPVGTGRGGTDGFQS